MTKNSRAVDGDDLFTLWEAYNDHAVAVAEGRRADEATQAANELETLRLLTLLAAEAEHLRATYAYVAVMDGATWSEVGQAAGMSKQGAQQRWGKNRNGTTAEEARKHRLKLRAAK